MKQELSRRDLLKLLVLAGLTVGSASVASAYRFEVNRYRLALSGLSRPLRLVQLSDLHYGPYIHAGSLRAWAQAAMAEAPELIVITGDFVDANTGRELGPLVSALSSLKAPLGVWGVWGNHDHMAARKRLGSLALLESALAEAGITILKNEGVRLRDDLYLAGIDDFWRGRPNIAKALEDREEGATLLLNHHPDFLFKVPQTVALTLCGHTHGGQVRLPFVGALHTSSAYGQRFAGGFVARPARAFISRGLGVSMLPLRTLCPAEIVRFDLLPREDSS